MMALPRVRTRALNALRHLSESPVEDLASTPHDIVWTRDKASLLRYRSDRVRHGTPVMLVMSLITKSYVFDLRPGSSLVEDLIDAGFDVFLLDWGVPGGADAANDLATYCDEYIPRAVSAVVSESGASDVSLVAYCMGGTLALLSVAGNADMPVRNLVALATPLDYAELRPLPSLLKAGRLDPTDVLDDSGNVPASVVRDLFAMVQPTARMVTLANMWQSTADDEMTAAHKALVGWSLDHIPFPGAAFTEVVQQFLRDRTLASGQAFVGGRTVELANVSCPVLGVVGDRDILVPEAASAPLASALGRDLDLVHLPAGHAGLFVGRQARKVCVPSVVAWLSEHN